MRLGFLIMALIFTSLSVKGEGVDVAPDDPSRINRPDDIRGKLQNIQDQMNQTGSSPVPNLVNEYDKTYRDKSSATTGPLSGPTGGYKNTTHPRQDRCVIQVYKKFLAGNTYEYRDNTRKALLLKAGKEPIETISRHSISNNTETTDSYRVSFSEGQCFVFQASWMTDDSMMMEKDRYDYLVNSLSKREDACRLIQKLYDYQRTDPSDCGCPAVQEKTVSLCAELGVPLKLQ